MGAEGNITLVRVVEGEFLISDKTTKSGQQCWPQFVVLPENAPICVFYAPFYNVGGWTNINVGGLDNLVSPYGGDGWSGARLVIVPGCLGLVVVPQKSITSMDWPDSLGDQWRKELASEAAWDACAAARKANIKYPECPSYRPDVPAETYRASVSAYQEALKAANAEAEQRFPSPAYGESKDLPLGAKRLSYLIDAWSRITPGRWLVSGYYSSGTGDDAPYYSLGGLPIGVKLGEEVRWEIWT